MKINNILCIQKFDFAKNIFQNYFQMDNNSGRTINAIIFIFSICNIFFYLREPPNCNLETDLKMAD